MVAHANSSCNAAATTTSLSTTTMKPAPFAAVAARPPSRSRNTKTGSGKKARTGRRRCVEVIGRKMEALRRLVPTGGDGDYHRDGTEDDGVDELLFRAADYIVRLQVQVTLEEDNVLVMKSADSKENGNGAGKRKRDEEEGDCKYIRLERRASPRSFVRKFRLPEDADAGGVTARCENGMLTVTVKKQPPPEKKPKSVQVAIA